MTVGLEFLSVYILQSLQPVPKRGGRAAWLLFVSEQAEFGTFE